MSCFFAPGLKRLDSLAIIVSTSPEEYTPSPPPPIPRVDHRLGRAHQLLKGVGHVAHFAAEVLLGLLAAAGEGAVELRAAVDHWDDEVLLLSQHHGDLALGLVRQQLLEAVA